MKRPSRKNAREYPRQKVHSLSAKGTLYAKLTSAAATELLPTIAHNPPNQQNLQQPPYPESLTGHQSSLFISTVTKVRSTLLWAKRHIAVRIQWPQNWLHGMQSGRLWARNKIVFLYCQGQGIDLELIFIYFICFAGA